MSRTTPPLRPFIDCRPVVMILVALSGCSSELDESRAKALIEESSAAGDYFEPIGTLATLMLPSTIDYQTQANSRAAVILGQLIDAQLVQRHTSRITYPDVSGVWAFNESKDDGRVNYAWRLELQMLEGSNHITGTGRYWPHGSSVGSGGPTERNPNSGTVSGSVEPDGSVVLRVETSRGYIFSGNPSFDYVVEGQTALLRQSNGRTVYTGGAPRTVERINYSYAFSPEVVISSEGVAVGGVSIGEVTGLQLVDETHAIANFAWTVTPNEFGVILLGEIPPSGVGTALFAKKPDGSWVLASQPQR